MPGHAAAMVAMLRSSARPSTTSAGVESESIFMAVGSHGMVLPRCSLAVTPTPLQRMGSAADVANAILFLMSDRAAFITGQVLTVDGGMSLQAQETFIL